MKFLNCVFYFLAFWVIVAAISTGHEDVYCFVFWGTKFLDTLIEGNFYYYADAAAMSGIPVNYPIFAAIMSAIVLAPCHVLLHDEFPQNSMYYIFYYKFVIALITIYSSFLVAKIALRLNFREHEARLGQILYLSSLYVQPVSVLYGQIDFLSNLFLLLGINQLLNNKLERSCWLFSLSFCVKPFSSVIIIPIICIIFYRMRKNLLLYIPILVCPIVFLNLFSYLCIHNYYINAKRVNDYYGFYYSLVSQQNYDIPLLCGIVCSVYLLATKKICYDLFRIITLPLIVFSCFALREIHIQWELYEIGAIVILILAQIRISPVIGVFSYIFLNFLLFFKLFLLGRHHFIKIFDFSIFKEHIESHYFNLWNYHFGGYDYLMFARTYLAVICIIVLFMNLKKIKNVLTFRVSSMTVCKTAAVVCLIPIFTYFYTLFSFISIK